MPLYGRRDIPGDKGLVGVNDQRNVLNRTIRASVNNVDAKNGVAILTYESFPGGGKYVTVAPLWMSFPNSKVGNPAWGRFMPQEGDIVRLSFDYDDCPTIVGYDVAANKDGVADGLTGWPMLNENYNLATTSPNSSNAMFANFIPIKPGEYDFMSSGGAYIYGNENGRLYMAGGTVSISMVKNDLRISSNAKLWSHTADDCELRFGQVRRINPVSQVDEPDSDDTRKEFLAKLKKTTTVGDVTTIMDLSTFGLGDIVDDLGTVVNAPTSNLPARLWYQSFNNGTESLKMAIDTSGNWDVIAPSATTGVKFDFSAGSWDTKFSKTVHTDTVSTVIASPSIKLGSSSAFESAVLGNTFQSKLNDVLTSLNIVLTSLVCGVGPVQSVNTPDLAAKIIALQATPWLSSKVKVE
jgi:hypothetical protein